MKPPEPGWKLYTECRFCDPDDLGTADSYRDWERIRTAATLRDYVDYIQPESAPALELEPESKSGPAEDPVRR